jgi:hypothetical protein
MKYGLLLIFSFCFFITACNNAEKTGTLSVPDETITEAALPKGKRVVDDAAVVTAAMPPKEPSSINGTGLSNTDTAQATVKEGPEADLKRRYKNLLVFHADDTMKINKSYIATLILGKDQVYSNLKSEVLTSSNAQDEKVSLDTTMEIGTKMRARLIDMSGAANKGFEIELIGGNEAAEQRISDKRKKAIWNWKLTPLAPGQQELKLAITVIEKEDEAVTLPTKNIPVLIFAEEETVMSKVGGFFEKNFQWVLATLLIPLFMGWFNARMRHTYDRKMAKEREQKEKEQAQAAAPVAPSAPPAATDSPKNSELPG